MELTININNRKLGVAILALIAVAALLRFYHLFQRPIGYDEGVHAYFTWQFVQTGTYTHNPARHGPLIYYLTAPFYALFSPSVLIGRIVVAAISLIGIASLYLLRDEFEPTTLLFAGVLLAIHPWTLHATRIFRSDSLLSAFLLLTFASYHRLRTTPRRKIAFGLGLSLALAISSKEIAYLVLPPLVIAPILVWHFHARYGDATLTELRSEYAPEHLFVSVGCCLMALAILYSGFPPQTAPWTNIVETITFWIDAAGGDSSGSPFFFVRGLVENAPLTTLCATIGVITTIIQTEKSQTRWHIIAWAAWIGLILSFLGHQWTWTGVHIFTPLAFIAAFGATDILTELHHLTAIVFDDPPANCAKAARAIATVLIVGTVILTGIAPVVTVDSTLGGPTDTGREAQLPSVLYNVSSIAEKYSCTVHWEGDSPWPGRWILHNVESIYHRTWNGYSYQESHIVVAWSESPEITRQTTHHQEQDGIHIYSSDKCSSLAT